MGGNVSDSTDDTLPPHSGRRADDPRLEKLAEDFHGLQGYLERMNQRGAGIVQQQEAMRVAIAENTALTSENTQRIEVLAGTMAEVKTGNDSLLEMKETVEKHIVVMCTWARWVKRGLWSLLSLAGVLVPILVAAKQLGLF